MNPAIAIALCAMGNRTWGDKYGNRWVGVALMALGIWSQILPYIGLHPLPYIGNHPLIHLGIIYALIFLYRMPATAPYLDFESKINWFPVIIRTLWIFPLPAYLFYIDRDAWHLISGFGSLLVLPLFYRLGAKWFGDGTAFAELLVGVWLGLMSMRSE